jgi:dTDP-4-dehydrorhamnose reductase
LEHFRADTGPTQILLTGARGQVGSELARALAPLGHVVAPTHAVLDLTDAAALRSTVRALRPAYIVNAAAYTAVDRAESEPAMCAAINADAPRILAEEAARVGAVMVHYSTDYVFDGSKGAPYVEDDPTAPLNVYGMSKVMGEQGVAGAGGRHLILRTSWVYGAHGSNFLRTMLKLSRERTELRVVNDQTGAPTWSRTIARTTAALLAHMRDAGATAPSGTYHLTSAGATTWYEFAVAILAGDPGQEEQVCQRVVPIRTDEYPTAARRPAYSVLDGAKIHRAFGVAVPDWRAELGHVLAELPLVSA